MHTTVIKLRTLLQHLSTIQKFERWHLFSYIEIHLESTKYVITIHAVLDPVATNYVLI